MERKGKVIPVFVGRGRSFQFLSEWKGKVILVSVRVEGEGHSGFCQSGRGRSFRFVRAEGEGHSSFCQSGREGHSGLCQSGSGRSFQFLSERKGKVIPVSVRAEGEGHSGLSERKGKVILVSVGVEGHSSFCQSGRGRSFHVFSHCGAFKYFF